MTSRTLATTTTTTTIYSKLLSRMAVRFPRTIAPSDSNSESDIPTNGSDLDSPHGECKKHRAFNRFLKEGPTFPCKAMKDEKYTRLDMPGIRKQGLKLWVEDNSQSRYKIGEIATDLKNNFFNIKRQMMMRNTCDRRRWFTSHADGVSNAIDVESNAFSVDAIDIEGPGLLHGMVHAFCIKEGEFPGMNNLIASSFSIIKEGKFPYINNLIDCCRLRRLFFEQKHNIILENYGLYKKGSTDWQVAGGSKLRYISIYDFMWWFKSIFPEKYKKGIYNYMFKNQIYVLESCPKTLLKDMANICYWRSPPDGWYKLNISGFFKENLGGTKEAGCGEVLRDSSGMILELLHKPLPDATSRDEVFLLGMHHGIDEILQRRSEAKKIILEIDHKKIVKVLKRYPHLPRENMELYGKIFDMLSKFDKYRILFEDPQSNSLAQRVAYIASHLTVGQSFPIGDRGYETEVRCDQWKIPRYEIVPKTRIEVEESSDEEYSDEEYSDDDFEF